MQAVTTIGLDIAKSVFQVHGVDVEGNVVVRRKVKRRYVVAFFQKLPQCLVGIEAFTRTIASARTMRLRMQYRSPAIRTVTSMRRRCFASSSARAAAR